MFVVLVALISQGAQLCPRAPGKPECITSPPDYTNPGAYAVGVNCTETLKAGVKYEFDTLDIEWCPDCTCDYVSIAGERLCQQPDSWEAVSDKDRALLFFSDSDIAHAGFSLCAVPTPDPLAAPTPEPSPEPTSATTEVPTASPTPTPKIRARNQTGNTTEHEESDHHHTHDESTGYGWVWLLVIGVLLTGSILVCATYDSYSPRYYPVDSSISDPQKSEKGLTF